MLAWAALTCLPHAPAYSCSSSGIQPPHCDQQSYHPPPFFSPQLTPSGSHEHVTLRLSCPKYYLICPTSRLFFVPQLECSFSFDFPRRTLPGPLLCNSLSSSSLSTLLPPPPPPVQFHRVSCRYSRPGPSLHACRAARPGYSACPELPPQPASCAARSSQDREEFWGLLVCHCFYDG